MRLLVEAEGVPKEGREDGEEAGCEFQSSDSESSQGSAMFSLLAILMVEVHAPVPHEERVRKKMNTRQ